jgi:hypothetical protein
LSFSGVFSIPYDEFTGASKVQIIGMSKEDLEGRHEKIRK